MGKGRVLSGHGHELGVEEVRKGAVAQIMAEGGQLHAAAVPV